MVKTLPNLAYPQDITWWQILFVILPASILSIVFFTIGITLMALWHFSSWLWKLSKGISMYSQRGADND